MLAWVSIVGVILRGAIMAVQLALDSLYQRSNNVSYKIVLATIAVVFLSRPLILIVVLEPVIIVTSIVTIVSASTVAIVSASTALSLAIVELILIWPRPL